MAINWDLYNKRLNINGSNNRERNLQCLQNTITNKLPDSLSYKAVKINNVDASIEIVKTAKDYIKVIHSLPNASFDCGDYILYNGKTYLIYEIDADDEVYTTGKMQLCTYTLKFQSPSGTILSYPCIDETTSSVGIDESNTITTLNNIHRIKLPFDDNTKLIDIDDRFFISKGGTATFVVTNVNDTEFNYGDKGLIVLTLKADELQADDRADLGICDYFIDTDTTPTGSYSIITCSNPSNELTLGSDTYRTLTANFYSNNVINTSIIPVWSFEYPSGFESYFTVVYDGKLAKIKVTENYDLLGQTVKVNVSNSSGAYKSSLLLTLTM